MTNRLTHVGVAGLLFTLACSSRVEIGHGNAEGGEGGDGPGASVGGGAGTKAQGGGGVDNTSGGTVSVGGSSTLPTSGSDSGGRDPLNPPVVGGPIPADGPQAAADKVDLLIAIDNSVSMAEKQKLFAKTVPELLTRLVSPYCATTGGAIVSRPATPDESCPSGSAREFAPLRDLHVGVITSSLGAHGAIGGRYVICSDPKEDDHAHLLPLERTGVPSYDGKGYFKWDPDHLASPRGEDDVQAFAASLEATILSAGENGCGYEAPLEAVYRFLVEPNPPVSIEVGSDKLSKRIGTDEALLKQRRDFLRPDSSVAVLILSDENDCSVLDEGYGHLVASSTLMYRSTSACADDPNDKCCQSCGEVTAHAGCGPINEDSECVKGVSLPAESDDLNLRCFDQKRRFGLDLLYPTARYVSGFGGGAVPDASGELVRNPLFHQEEGGDRDPSLFSLAVIGGVPWQDLATDSSLTGDELEYLTAQQLKSAGRWPVILGNPKNDVPPTDVFMRESADERSGTNPITGDSAVDSSSTDPEANAINGHEQKNPADRDLQYACTFDLPEPVVCDQAAADDGVGCDCFSEELEYNRSICNPPGGGAPTTTQYRAKAYPMLRPLAVAQELGRRSVLSSICARNTQDAERSDYGYRPAFGALGKRIAGTLVK
jgi:hypothetical protein